MSTQAPETYPIPLDLTAIIDALAQAEPDYRGFVWMTPQLRDALIARLKEVRALAAALDREAADLGVTA